MKQRIGVSVGAIALAIALSVGLTACQPPAPTGVAHTQQIAYIDNVTLGTWWNVVLDDCWVQVQIGNFGSAPYEKAQRVSGNCYWMDIQPVMIPAGLTNGVLGNPTCTDIAADGGGVLDCHKLSSTVWQQDFSSYGPGSIWVGYVTLQSATHQQTFQLRTGSS